MSYESCSPPSPKRRLEKRTPIWNVEVIHWSDNTSTVNLFVSGIPNNSYGPIEGRITLPQALAWLAINARIE